MDGCGEIVTLAENPYSDEIKAEPDGSLAFYLAHQFQKLEASLVYEQCRVCVPPC